jgi:ATP-binding protein involved in chromosome partitioning
MNKEKQECDTAQLCETCAEAGTCSEKEKQAHEERRLKDRLYHIRHKIMVMSGKGGVGKSTVAVNLATALALDGFRVGILDADIHGPNIPKMLGLELYQLMGTGDGIRPVEFYPNVKVVSIALLSGDSDAPVVWRGPLKHAMIKQFLADVEWGDLDYLIVDLPPGTGDEALSVAHLIENVDGSVVVTTPQEVALLDSRKAVGFSRLLKIKVLGIVENMSGMTCPHCGKEINLFKVGGGETAARNLMVPFLGRIPIDPEVVTMCDQGTPLVLSKPDSAAAKVFFGLSQAVSREMERGEKEKAEQSPVRGGGS